MPIVDDFTISLPYHNICTFLRKGGIHKLREQGRGRGVVLKMFTLVHKGEEGGSANVHVGLNCKYFK